MAKAKEAAAESLPAKIEDLTGEAALLALVERPGESQGEATAEDARTSMSGATPNLEEIQIKHQGAKLFVLPGGKIVSGDEGITCIVMAHTFQNVFFEHDFEHRVEGERPLCASTDGVNVKAGVRSPQAPDCTVCPRNRNARDMEARRRAFDADRKEACANTLTLAVIIPGHALPYQLKLAASSFKAWDTYVQRLLTQGRYLVREVVTKIKLESVGQFKHSEARFENLGRIKSPEIRDSVKAQADGYLALIRRDFGTREATADAASEAIAKAKAAEASADSPL